MNQPSAPALAWKTLAVAGAFLATVHGAHAATPAQDVAKVSVVGQLPLREACPGVDAADLADALVPAWQDADKPSAVVVTFKVQGGHVYDVAPATGSARTFHQVRRVVHGLACNGGDDQAHAVRFVVRFVDGTHDSRMATINDVDVDVDDPSGR
jgi:hypothetical protein